jgi:hypothetical protein
MRLVLCGAALALVWVAQAQTLAALKIPPVKVSIDLDHQTVEVTVWGTISPGPAGVFTLAVTVDLGGLQSKLTSVLGAELNRSDPCGERLTVEKASIAPDAPASVLTANVDFERYGCVKALGKQIVKRLLGGHGVIEVTLLPSIEDNKVMLAARVRNIDADGPLGDVLRSSSFSDSIREQVEDSIEAAIQKSANLKLTLPGAIGDAANIQAVQFANGGAGRLWLTMGGEVRLSAEQVRRVVGK